MADDTSGEIVRVEQLSKTFVLHNQGSAELTAFAEISFSVHAGEAVVLHGPSGSGKSSLLRILYGNYLPSAGRVLIKHRGAFVDIGACDPRVTLDVRRNTINFVSQFLRVIPRVATRDIVMDPLLRRGAAVPEARARAEAMLERLHLPARLWDLPPATFSGGEQQRVNIARSFVHISPVMLLDEPTAALDEANRAVVVELVSEARRNGAAIIGIFHDDEVRKTVATRLFDMAGRNPLAA